MATNAGIAAVVDDMAGRVGPFLLVHLPIVVLAATIGVWLFYLQHQFEHTVWVGDGTWNLQEAALRGSSHYVLPSPLRWFTANIGIHHIHHLCSRIPFYRLPLVLRDHPDLDGIGRLTLLSESQVRATGAVGRRSATARPFPRAAPALCFDLKVILRRDWE
jgi:acyl-lipid omega-6 desaturase (Delta-12 desaturase)